MQPLYDTNILKSYLRRRQSTSYKLPSGKFRSWTSQRELAEHLGVTLRYVERWVENGFPKTWKHAEATADFLGIEPCDLLRPDDKQVYLELLIDFRELIRSGATVSERNLETVRLSREVIRWQKFFEVGRWDVDPEVEAAEQEHTLEIEREVAKRVLGI